MSDAKMPQRYDIRVDEDGRLDYDAVENGDWVDAEDVEPLVAEVNRLRARVEELEYAYSKALAALGGVQQDAGPP